MTRVELIRAIILAIALALPPIASAQITPQPALKRGGEVFAQTCTQSYCHGANGAAGGAPQLANRGFTAAYIERVVTYGIPGTPMAAWGQLLPLADVRAIIEYVESLNGIAPSVRFGSPPVLTGEAARGRDLFFDPTEAARCSNCHRVNEKGISVAPPSTSIPPDAHALRNIAAPHVGMATVHGETFPALVTAQVPNEVKLYDLTQFPPVLRTFRQSEVTVKESSTWKHATVLGSYSDMDLESILTFLRVVKTP